MIEELIKKPLFRKIVPPVAGLIFTAAFVSLGLWQLDRAAEKKALLESFGGDAPYARVNDFTSLGEFDRIRIDGNFLTDHQILIDNIVLDGRLGYYVVTPFRPNANRPTLMVNRGWIQKPGQSGELPDIHVEQNLRTVRGLVGHLPRVGIRPGDAFAGPGDWPRIAVYPNLDEISAQLDEPLLPLLLLLAPDEEGGFLRRWQPNLSGPMTHYGYAFQWFAMAMTVVALLFWHFRKGYRRDSATV